MEILSGRQLDSKGSLLSVIVPIYNIEQYLPKCIDSIIAQTYKQIEILLVNDGSTDKCPQICDMYAQKDNRIKVIHKRNGGLVRARKTGLTRANGEYITFVDGDDWIEADMFLKLMGLLERTDVDFIDSGFFCDNNGRLERKRTLRKGIYELDENSRHKFFLALLNLDTSFDGKLQIWSKIFKADIIKASYAKVPDTMQYGEDAVNMLYCILISNRIMQTDDLFYHYSYREESMSHIKSNSFIRKELELWNYCGNLILNHDPFMCQEHLDRSLFKRMYSSFQYLLSNEFDTIQYYSFPNIEELFGKKIVIFGAGRVGKDYLTQISKFEKCEIVCWVDRDYKRLKFKYREVVGVEQLMKITYDIILIAVAEKMIADEIKQLLLEKDIPETKLLWCKPDIPF